MSKWTIKNNINKTTLIRRLMQPLYLLRNLAHKRFLRDIISIILLALSLFLLAGTLFTGSSDDGAGSVTGFLSLKPVVVMSGSMEPTIQTNALVLVRQTAHVSEGDIVLYYRDSTPVLHRYIETTEDGRLITKGDNNPEPDFQTIEQGQIYGKAILKANFLAPLISACKKQGWSGQEQFPMKETKPLS